MEVYALIGASGTGKSHNANSVLEEYGIEMMIDDGLLIKDGKKMAGTSAKAEETTVAAVKRAIFHDPMHAAEVRERIAHLQPKKILILGTSEKMIDKITAALNLPPPENHELYRMLEENGGLISEYAPGRQTCYSAA